jgi:hypothetical protein
MRQYHALRNTFVIKVCDLLAQVKIFEQRRPTLTSFERIIGVLDSHALIGCQQVAIGPLAKWLKLSFLAGGGIVSSIFVGHVVATASCIPTSSVDRLGGPRPGQR